MNKRDAKRAVIAELLESLFADDPYGTHEANEDPAKMDAARNELVAEFERRMR